MPTCLPWCSPECSRSSGARSRTLPSRWGAWRTRRRWRARQTQPEWWHCSTAALSLGEEWKNRKRGWASILNPPTDEMNFGHYCCSAASFWSWPLHWIPRVLSNCLVDQRHLSQAWQPWLHQTHSRRLRSSAPKICRGSGGCDKKAWGIHLLSECQSNRASWWMCV